MDTKLFEKWNINWSEFCLKLPYLVGENHSTTKKISHPCHIQNKKKMKFQI